MWRLSHALPIALPLCSLAFGPVSRRGTYVHSQYSDGPAVELTSSKRDACHYRH